LERSTRCSENLLKERRGEGKGEEKRSKEEREEREEGYLRREEHLNFRKQQK
jgi:hypothetical protein